MSQEEGQPTERTVVFRPKRRCPNCGLINVDLAPRCRRCRASFADLDVAVESERLVERVRLRRNVLLAIAAALLVGAGLSAYGLYDRFQEAERFAGEFRSVLGDVRSMELAAQSDAGALSEAIDEVELRLLMRQQLEVWRQRAERCQRLREKLGRLVPPQEADAREHLAATQTVTRVEVGSVDLTLAMESGEVDRVRSTAADFLQTFQ